MCVSVLRMGRIFGREWDCCRWGGRREDRVGLGNFSWHVIPFWPGSSGAVMFLFEGDFGNILHTGDCRLIPECLQNLPQKYVTKKGKEPKCQFDYVFLDCTFGRSSLHIPSKHLAIQQVILVALTWIICRYISWSSISSVKCYFRDYWSCAPGLCPFSLFLFISNPIRIPTKRSELMHAYTCVHTSTYMFGLLGTFTW